VTKKKQIIVSVGGCLFAVLALRLGCKYGFADSGSASGFGDLQPVFHRSGDRISATSTNRSVAQFPFTGRIAWELWLFRGTSLDLSGSVDTNSLAQFIAANPRVDFIFLGRSLDGREVWKGTDGLIGYESRNNGNDAPLPDTIAWEAVSFSVEQDTVRGWAIIKGGICLTNQTGSLRIIEDGYRSR
jgi:hypothetical protein